MGKLQLSAAFQSASGALGELIIAQVHGAPIARRRPRYRRPTALSQAAAAQRFSAAAAAWNALTTEQAQTWRDYAEGIMRSDPVTATHYRGSARTEYMALATKFLQATPGGAVPALPPTSSYSGDRVVVGVARLPGAVRWTASGPNDDDSATELLLQKLPNPRRKPTKQYTSAAFVEFAAGSLSFDMFLEAGAYAFAYRFVRLSTGQATLVIPCGVVTVE